MNEVRQRASMIVRRAPPATRVGSSRRRLPVCVDRAIGSCRMGRRESLPQAHGLDDACTARIPYRAMGAAPKVLIPDKEIDCVCLFCPMPIIQSREAMEGMIIGEILVT